MSTFLDTVRDEFNRMRARAFAGDGYEGVTHAGIAIVAADSGLWLATQRAADPTDDPEVAETWEFPGGGLETDEEPLTAAFREYAQEVGCPLPEGEVVNGWRAGPTDNYQGFVYRIATAFDLGGFVPNDEVQAVAWLPPKAPRDLKLRPEMAHFDWTVLDPAIERSVSGNEDDMTDDAPVEADDDTDYGSVFAEPIPIHGVLAPEEVATGDKRAFAAGSVTSRPYRLPFRWAETDTGAHNGAFAVGSVDRLMRKDGLIHYEGRLMNTAKADEFAGLMQFFDGRYGVSVDGDNGNLDAARSKADGVAWFDAVRASGLTAVDIPAFAEAYVAFGPHPDMPTDATLTASMAASGDLVTFAPQAFDRGPGWVTNPRETKRLHDYWTKKGQPGYAKIGWGTPGDFTRAKKLIGEKIGLNSPEDLKYLNQIIAQWHHDALGYWPGDLGKPGNAPDTPENRRRAAVHAGTEKDPESSWDLVLTSSAGARVLPPASYFDRHPDTENTIIEDPDEFGIRRTYGYAAEWGVCHIGYEGQCVTPPEDPYGGEYRDYHLGRTKTADAGYLKTGLITYRVKHRDAQTILAETPEQAHFDDISSAWAAVRLGEDERGVWFSGVVLPHVPEEDITLIEASGQVSGEWKYGALRTLLTVGVPGFPVMSASVEYDENGNMLALAACAHPGANEVADAPCTEHEPTASERMEALRLVDAEVRMARLRAQMGV